MFFLSLLMNSRIVQAIVAALAVVAAFFAWLHFHDKEIKRIATEEFNKAQMEIVKKSDLEYKQKTIIIDKNEEAIRQVIQEKDAEISDLELQIQMNAAKEKGGQNPSSDYLKSIVKQLDKAYGEK